jgi:hypothetical protein
MPDPLIFVACLIGIVLALRKWAVYFDKKKPRGRDRHASIEAAERAQKPKSMYLLRRSARKVDRSRPNAFRFRVLAVRA